ncbi:MAG: tetratricopeptide repeat protein, partial [Chloroflexi bacterium]
AILRVETKASAEAASAEVTALNNIGAAYSFLGEKQEALGYYNQALTIARAIKDPSVEGSVLNNIAGVYQDLEDNPKALDYYSQALTIFQNTGRRTEESTALSNLGLVWNALGDKEKALASYNQALKVTQDLGAGNSITAAVILDGLGGLYASLGERGKALEYWGRALPLARKVADYRGEAVILANSAWVKREMGIYPEALMEIEAALKILDSLRTKVTGPELRASYFSTVHDYYDFYIDLLMELHSLHPTDGYDAMALTASERARARSLLELLMEAGAGIRQGVDTNLLDEERSVQQSLDAKAQRLTKMLSGQHTEEQVTAAKRELDDLTLRYRNVETQIRNSSPRYAALTQPSALTVGEIQQQLDPDTVLMEYSLVPYE